MEGRDEWVVKDNGVKLKTFIPVFYQPFRIFVPLQQGRKEGQHYLRPLAKGPSIHYHESAQAVKRT